MTTGKPQDAYDLSDILAEEARMLRARSFGSARVVMIVIFLAAAAIAMSGRVFDAVIWCVLSSLMVGVTLVYARIVWAGGIPDNRVQTYLRGHVGVTAMTGLLWGGFAIWFSEPTEEIRTFVAALLLTSITAGGALSGTVYRPGYLALIVTSLLPFGSYLLAFGEGVLHVFGYFILFYFGMCYVTNERLSQRTRDDIVADLGREAARKILEQSEEIERLYSQKTRFMANISHDMTQPMLAQRHLLGTLMGQLTDPADITILQQIENTHASQERLIQELAELSQVETQAFVPRPERIDLDVLFSQLQTEFASRTGDRDMCVTTFAGVPEVSADRHLVERILRNLMSNAVGYAGQGATIALTSEQDERGVILSVADTGPGLTEDDLAVVFDEYMRLDPDSATQGSGLGLTISRRLAGQMDGKLELVSSPGNGTRGVLILPDVPEHDPEPARFVVLVGRDTSADLGPWANLFSAWMWEFAHAPDVPTARNLVQVLRLSPDAIVVDWPTNGIASEDLVQLREIAPVLVVTDTPEARFSEDVTVLQTPLGSKELREHLERISRSG